MNPFRKPGPHQRKSAITAPMHRMPGQSLKETLDELVTSKMIWWIGYPALFFVAFLTELVCWFFKAPRQPLLFFIAFLITAVFGFWRITRLKKNIQPLKIGLEGERAVGQFLDEHIRPLGYKVFHDLTENDSNGTKFNIDHVLIGPSGVYTVETKTRSKPAIGSAVVNYNGQAVSVEDGPADEAPLKQAKAAARRVRETLQELTGHKNIHVQPIVVFPGWYIEGSSSGKEVWVLNPKSLPAWLENARTSLASETVALYGTVLSKDLRNREQN